MRLLWFVAAGLSSSVGEAFAPAARLCNQNAAVTATIEISTAGYRTSASTLCVRPTKWDNIVDEDEDDPTTAFVVKPDMEYIPRNVVRQHKNFVALREISGRETTNDLYVREPNSEVFWYCGKVVRVSDVSVELCVARLWHMIEMHATNMRPIELFPSRGKLEIWIAPGDSELEVAYNRPTLKMQKMERLVEGADSVKSSLIGFQGEVYEGGIEGFRTWRTDEGLPARPEINPGGETRPPTPQEMIQLQKELNDQSADTPLPGDQ